MIDIYISQLFSNIICRHKLYENIELYKITKYPTTFSIQFKWTA